MPENIGDAEVTVSGDIGSLRDFVLRVKKSLGELEKSDVAVKLEAKDKLTPEIKKVTKAADELHKKKVKPTLAANDKASSLIDRIGARLKKIHGQKATAKVDIKDDASDKVDKLAGKIKGLVAGTAIVGGIYLLGRAVKDLGGSAIGGAADMEQYRITLETVMGSAQKAADTLAWVVQFAKATPFEIPGLMEATVRLQAYGIDATKVLGTIGDASAALGKDVMEGVEAVADAQTGEFERLKEFGVKAIEVGKDQVTQYGLHADAMGKTMLMYTDKNGKEAFKIVDRNNREIVTSSIMAIWNERYAGNMAKQALSWKGMISNIKDSVGQGLTSVGESIMPILKPYLQGALDFLSGPQFAGFAAGIAQGVAQFLPVLIDFGAKIAEGVGLLMQGFKPAFDTILEVFKGNLGPAIGDVVTGVGEFIGKFIEAANDSGMIKAAMDNISTAMRAISDTMNVLNALHVPQFIAIFSRAASVMTDFIGPLTNVFQLINDIKDAAEWLDRTLPSWLGGHRGEVLKVVFDPTEPVTAFKSMYAELEKVQQTEHPILDAQAKKAMENICNQVIKHMPIAANNQRKLMEAMKSVIANTDMRTVTGEKINQMAQEIADKTGVPVEQVLLLMQAMTGTVGNTNMQTPTEQAMAGIPAGVIAGKSAAIDAISSVMGDMQSYLDSHSLTAVIGNVISTVPGVAASAAIRVIERHSGGEITPIGVRMHSGGEVPVITQIGEFMMQRSAVQRYGVSMMKTINEGRFGGGGENHNHWGPVSFPNVRSGADAQSLRDEMNKMAEHAEDLKSAGGSR